MVSRSILLLPDRERIMSENFFDFTLEQQALLIQKDRCGLGYF